ncbi:MAG TPA: hypothetical protein VFQ95_06400 [Rhodanobacteraceae bacterium]|nr:hypothetical protein [Rhodanobacteraceae bacterium]
MRHEQRDQFSSGASARRPRTASTLQNVALGGVVLLASVALLALAGCGSDNNAPPPQASAPQPGPPPLTADGFPATIAGLDPVLVQQGQKVFRYDTFGDETFWTGTLQMNQVIQQAVTPLVAASVGIKIDVDKLPPSVVQGVVTGTIPLNSTQTTLALIQLGAVVGIKGDVETDPATGQLTLKSVGVTCALCHSTVSKDVHVDAPGGVDLTGIVGHRLDGWPNRDLNPGAIIALSPAVNGGSTPTAAQKAMTAVYNSWGAGFYDPRFNVNIDPGSNAALAGTDVLGNITAYLKASDTPLGSPAGTRLGNPTLIPPAYGLVGITKSIYTGDGDTAHEPAGPVAYWNRYVGVTQMHGHGTFSDPRLLISNASNQPLSVNFIDSSFVCPPITADFPGPTGPDCVTAVLPALQAYQWSIAAPAMADDGGEFGFVSDLDPTQVAAGKTVFDNSCASCHNPNTAFTDVNSFGLHQPSASVALKQTYLAFSATKMWRTSPLAGIWEHPPYLHDGSGAYNASTGKCMDGSTITPSSASSAMPSTLQAAATNDLACTVNLYDSKMNLALTDTQKTALVQYLKSL